jgi:hypothetical protein
MPALGSVTTLFRAVFSAEAYAPFADFARPTEPERMPSVAAWNCLPFLFACVSSGTLIA